VRKRWALILSLVSMTYDDDEKAPRDAKAGMLQGLHRAPGTGAPRNKKRHSRAAKPVDNAGTILLAAAFGSVGAPRPTGNH